MVMEEGLSIGGLSIPKSTLDYWVKKAREGKLLDNSYKKHKPVMGSGLIKKHKPVTPEEMELARLRRDNVAQIPHSPYVQGIKSGYYLWCKRPPSKREIENRRLEVGYRLPIEEPGGYLDPIDNLMG